MESQNLHAALLEALYDVAPDLATRTIDDHASLQNDYGLDSADFLNFLIRIKERIGIDVPPQSYRACATFGGALRYLSEESAQISRPKPRDAVTTAMP